MPRPKKILPQKFYTAGNEPRKLLSRVLGVLAFQIDQLERWALNADVDELDPHKLKQTLSIAKDLNELIKQQEKEELEELKDLEDASDEEIDAEILKALPKSKKKEWSRMDPVTGQFLPANTEEEPSENQTTQESDTETN